MDADPKLLVEGGPVGVRVALLDGACSSGWLRDGDSITEAAEELLEASRAPANHAATWAAIWAAWRSFPSRRGPAPEPTTPIV